MSELTKKLRQRWKLVLGVSVGGFLAAVILMVTGAAGLAYTSTEEFCISCHEMKNNVYTEYKGTIHDTNRTGVRAICTDCHVPREPVALLIRKFQATGELYHHFITGSINTPEKFAAKRHELATHVWQRQNCSLAIRGRTLDVFEPLNVMPRSNLTRGLRWQTKCL